MEKNIYTRLANGESSDAIAAEFTAALNEAMARHAKDEEEKAAKAAAEHEAAIAREVKLAAKREGMVALIDNAFTYIAKNYPELGLEAGDWSDEELAAIADLLILMLDLEILKAMHGNGEVKMKPRITVKTAKTRDENADPFAAFFKELGL